MFLKFYIFQVRLPTIDHYLTKLIMILSNLKPVKTENL